MLKRIFSLFLLVLIFCSTFTWLFYFAGYQLNKDYIAKELCINKDKPELHCNGKCFLSRKIAEAEKKQQNQEKQTQKDLYQQIMLVSTFQFKFFKVNQTQDLSFYQNNYHFKNRISIFHPPPFFNFQS